MLFTERAQAVEARLPARTATHQPSTRSAAASTTCRLRLSSPLRGRRCSRRERCSRGSSSGWTCYDRRPRLPARQRTLRDDDRVEPRPAHAGGAAALRQAVRSSAAAARSRPRRRSRRRIDILSPSSTRASFGSAEERFWMLETIGEFALERLEARARNRAGPRRHAEARSPRRPQPGGASTATRRAGSRGSSSSTRTSGLRWTGKRPRSMTGSSVRLAASFAALGKPGRNCAKGSTTFVRHLPGTPHLPMPVARHSGVER